MVDQLNEHDLGHLLELEGVQYASPTFLDQVNAPLYLWYVFFCYCGIPDKDGYQDPELFKNCCPLAWYLLGILRTSTDLCCI